MIPRFFLALIAAASLFAQDPDAAPQPPGPPDLKTFLSLADNQIQALALLQMQQAHAIQPVLQQRGALQQKLQQLVEAPNPDPAAVGQVVLAITALDKQIQQALTNFQQQRVSILSSDQKGKLPALVQALVLQASAIQAASLGLINPPGQGY
jgi:hypothetical protein